MCDLCFWGGGNHCGATPAPLLPPVLQSEASSPSPRTPSSTLQHTPAHSSTLPGARMAGTAAPKRQDTRKFFENLSGAGKSIAVLTSGGDAQGNLRVPSSDRRPPAPQTQTDLRANKPAKQKKKNGPVNPGERHV